MTDKPTYEELEQRVKELNREVKTYKSSELEGLSHLRFLEIMDKIDQVIRGSDDIDEIMRDVLETVLTIFQCDRVWLMYPCDPEAAFWRVPMECTRPKYPGAFSLNQDIPMTSEMVESFKAVLKSKDPLVFHPEHGLPLPDSAKQFSIQSSINNALYPKVGRPWMWGLSQCSHARQWTEAEISIFQEIGRRISDSLSILLTLRNLKESEERFRNVHETAPLAFVVWDNNTCVTDWNKKAEEIFGWSKEEVVGYNFFDFLIPEKNRPQVKDVVNGLLKGDLLSHLINENLTKEGKIIICEWNNSALHDDDGNTIGAISLGLDITERKQAEEALRESEKKYRRIYDNIIDAYYEATIDGIILEISPSIEKHSQYNREELIGKSLYDIYTNPEERNKLIEDLINDGKVDEYELTLKDKDDTQRLCSINAILIKDKNGNPTKIIGILRDISNRKKAEKENMELEEKLARSKKMESLGLLAGGVAHDLNNVLSGIVGYPELLLMDLPEDSKLRKPIEIIQESGHSAAAIVQDLLTIARGVAITKDPLNLNELINDYSSSPEFINLKQFHPTVTVKTELDMELLNISGSHVHIRKVLMNLVSNAGEAIEGSGNVTISTVNRYVDRPLRGYDDVKIGEYVVLVVSDDGPGISSDDLERVFEPFYTKKIMGRSGTGLGLAVVWNVVQDHKGYIDVTSDENGTTFELYFPITREEISDKHLSIPIKDFQGNRETILVVDDVESQRDISCKMLDKLGYKAKAVSSGEEAVEYLKENTVDLLLLDMIMNPGINGRETYKRIIEIHPKQKAIIVSGFAETGDVKEAQRLGAGQYVKKPLTLEKIGMAVKKELEI